MNKKCKKDEPVLNAQKKRWENTYSEEPNFFGEEPSYSAIKATDLFRAEGKSRVLELGAGQGRDALFFASKGFKVTALDYSETAVKAIRKKANRLRLTKQITALSYDVRKSLPFADATFDACYCHMLYCMALCTSELESLFREVSRILKPNGLNVYTVRNTADPNYGKGIPRGEGMYEMGGFIVHFFSLETVNHLAEGFDVVDISEFEEGELPRRLYLVFLRKMANKEVIWVDET